MEGATDTFAFDTQARDVLAPTLQPGDIVLVDNLLAHKGQLARPAVEARGAHLEFLPPHSLDMNPIKKCRAKVKQALRAAKAPTWDELASGVRDALLTVTPTDVPTWFARCGYALT